MKTILNFFSLLSFLPALCSCEESPFQPNDRLPVQGKWKIEQLTFQTIDEKDSVVTTNLGFLEFGSCRKSDNRIGLCEKGKRIYADGDITDFYFQTGWGSDPWGNSGKRLWLHYRMYRLHYDLIGGYNINKLTKNELVFSCVQCAVGGIPFRKFELRATK